MNKGISRGVVLNLFEIRLPSEPIPVMSKSWDDPEKSLREVRRNILPALLYASEENGKLYAYGEASTETERLGFTHDSFMPSTAPRFTGRIIIDGIVHQLTNKPDAEFELQQRQYSAKIHEVTNLLHPIQRVENRLDVFPSYLVQTVFLRVAGQLRYFLMVNPKARYRFVHSLPQIIENSKINISGRFVRLSCPKMCDVYECELYSFKGMLAGKFSTISDSSQFSCRFPGAGCKNSHFVELDDRSRFDFAIPIEICELEASTSNINVIFSQRFSPGKASTIISDLRVLTGDLLHTSPRPSINTEVGQRRWTDVLSLIQQLAGEIPLFNGPSIRIAQEPVRAVEGGYTPEGMFEQDAETGEEIEDAADDTAF